MSRHVRRVLFWIGVVVLGGVAGSNIVLPAPAGEHLFGAFSRMAIRDNFVFALVIFVGVVVAGSLAADRRRGYPSLILIRGISRRQYVVAKAAAMGAAAGGGVALACASAVVLASFFLTWGSGGAGQPAGPYPGLLSTYPLANDVALIALLSLGAAGLALSGMAFGAVVANEYLAAAVPFVLMIGGIFVFRADALLFLGPYTQVSLVGSYTYALPWWAWSFTAPVYWCVFGGLCIAIALFTFWKKEEV